MTYEYSSKRKKFPFYKYFYFYEETKYNADNNVHWLILGKSSF